MRTEAVLTPEARELLRLALLNEVQTAQFTQQQNGTPPDSRLARIENDLQNAADAATAIDLVEANLMPDQRSEINTHAETANTTHEMNNIPATVIREVFRIAENQITAFIEDQREAPRQLNPGQVTALQRAFLPIYDNNQTQVNEVIAGLQVMLRQEDTRRTAEQGNYDRLTQRTTQPSPARSGRTTASSSGPGGRTPTPITPNLFNTPTSNNNNSQTPTSDTTPTVFRPEPRRRPR